MDLDENWLERLASSCRIPCKYCNDPPKIGQKKVRNSIFLENSLSQIGVSLKPGFNRIEIVSQALLLSIGVLLYISQ